MYVIKDRHGNVVDTATEWMELMQKYGALHKVTKEPVFLEKIDDEKEKEL